MMRRTLLMQRMEEVLTPRELNLVRSYLGIGQPDEVGLTFQELAIRLNYNGPSGAEKAYKAALRKLKKDLYSGAYGRWLSAQKAIRTAKAEAEQDAGHGATPQRTWWGGEGAGESVCLRGRSTDPCLRGAQRSLIKKVFKSKCNKTPFPCITRMTGDKSPCSVC